MSEETNQVSGSTVDGIQPGQGERTNEQANAEAQANATDTPTTNPDVASATEPSTSEQSAPAEPTQGSEPSGTTNAASVPHAEPAPAGDSGASQPTAAPTDVPSAQGSETPAAPADQEMTPPQEEKLPEYAQANPEREDVPEIIEVENRVVFEGQNVSSVLRDGKELRTPDGLHITHYHCTMADGTTKHIPVSYFGR